MNEKELLKMKPAEAEKFLKEKIKEAVAAYEEDKEKNDLQLGAAFYNLAKLYASLIKCNRLHIKPIQLEEPGQKMWKAAELLFNDAIGCTLANGKAGKAVYVDFHSTCMYEMLIFYAAVGKYEEAIRHGENGIRLEKAIYEKFDDAKHSVRLAERMSALAAVRTANNQLEAAMELLEDAIFALEEHETEDQMNLGIMVGRTCISLASTYERIPDEAEQVEATYRKGYAKIDEAYEMSKGKFLDDMVHASIMMGEYFKRKNSPESKEYFKEALKLAQDFKEQTGNAKFDYIIAKLKVQVR